MVGDDKRIDIIFGEFRVSILNSFNLLLGFSTSNFEVKRTQMCIFAQKANQIISVHGSSFKTENNVVQMLIQCSGCYPLD